MDTKEVKDKKVETPAQGAEGTTETKGTEVSELTITGDTIETGIITEEEEVTPEWAVKLLESNQAVIDSNKEMIEAIGQFNEGASNVVMEIMATANASSSNQTVEIKKEAVQVKVNPKAKYVVCEGKKFADKDDPSFIYEPGYNVSKLGTDRLQNLLSQGIIQEAED